MFGFLSTLTLALLGSAAAQFTITSPTSEIFWVANSDNVVSWTGDAPAAQFTVFITNLDVNLLTDRTPIVAILDAFRGSYLLNPGPLRPGQGYTIQASPKAVIPTSLTDILNSTNVYAESQAFELKPAGSTYPTVTPGGAASPATATQSGMTMGTATSTGAQGSAAASSAPANGAEALGLGWTKVAGVVGLGAVGALLV